MKDHRWAPLNTVAHCRAPRHDKRWETASGADRVICWDCRRCFGCADRQGCTARNRPGFPETPRPVENRAKAGAGMVSGEKPERGTPEGLHETPAPVAPVQKTSSVAAGGGPGTAGAVGEPTVSGTAADQPREPERAPATPVEVAA